MCVSEREQDAMADKVLERELRAALGRVDAPSGFAGRVMARTAERSGVREERSGWWRAVAAAFLLGAMCGGWLMHQERVDRREAMRTREQFAVAMRVTARATERSFTEAGRKINRTGDEGERR